MVIERILVHSAPGNKPISSPSPPPSLSWRIKLYYEALFMGLCLSLMWNPGRQEACLSLDALHIAQFWEKHHHLQSVRSWSSLSASCGLRFSVLGRIVLTRQGCYEYQMRLWIWKCSVCCERSCHYSYVIQDKKGLSSHSKSVCGPPFPLLSHPVEYQCDPFSWNILTQFILNNDLHSSSSLSKERGTMDPLVGGEFLPECQPLRTLQQAGRMWSLPQ